MRKIRGLASFLDKNILKIGVGFLLIFIPLWPKLPLLDIENTWIYVRLEDFFVAALSFIFLIQLLRGKASLKTPLTVPILVFWLVGAISTTNALFFLSDKIAGFFPHLAILHYARRIEYIIVFFIAFSTVRSVKDINHYLAILAVTLVGVIAYGIGQKLGGLPAFLTMNEEFSKGWPLYLPPTARVSSTFAGHYDLAAFLVFMIAILGSLTFGLQKSLLKLGTLVLAFMSFILLLLTASRISFAVYLPTVSLLLWWQNKKLLVIPVLLASLLLMNFVTESTDRFAKTFRIKEVLYDVQTGRAIGAIEEIKKPEGAEGGELVVIEEEKSPAEESLPTGSRYIGLPVAPPPTPSAKTIKVVSKKTLETTTDGKIATVSGDFLIQKALYYDISFTTRIEGGWPRAIEAFKRNPVLGSGYSSISLATDNGYLRALGETGIAGLLSFTLIFLFLGIYTHSALKKIHQPLVRSLGVGMAAGLTGLLLNAVLIDVFEASKVAYSFWLFLGISLGGFNLYFKEKINWPVKIWKLLKHPYAFLIYLFILTFTLNGLFLNNYFVGDDFTWLAWAARDSFSQVFYYFTEAAGFFYRPLQKLIYLALYNVFWLEPAGYHFMSLFLHFLVTSIWFLFVLKLTRNQLLAVVSSLIFTTFPFHGESIFWISTLGHLVSTFFVVLALYSYYVFRFEKKRRFFIYTILLSLFAVLAYEGGIVVPFLIFWFELILGSRDEKRVLRLVLVGLIIPGYLALRTLAGAHGLSGDYNYNLALLPLNVLGNLFGYLGSTLIGPRFLPWYEALRDYGRVYKGTFFVLSLEVFVLSVFIFLALKRVRRNIFSKESLFALGFIPISLLPFLGLGNLAERYAYLTSLGVSLLLATALTLIFEKIKLKSQWGAKIILLTLLAGLLSFYQSELFLSGKDWQQAGERAKKIILTLKNNFSLQTMNKTFIFVNHPIREGRAWLFPVGLDDALWHAFRDETLNIEFTSGLNEAFEFKERVPNSHVFVFENGEIQEATRETQIIPAELGE